MSGDPRPLRGQSRNPCPLRGHRRHHLNPGRHSRHHLNPRERAGEQRHQPGLALQHHPKPPVHQLRDQARSHDFVADALFFPDQKPPPGHGAALPKRLRIGPPHESRRLPPIPIALPPGGQLPQTQQRQAPVEDGFGKVRPHHQRPAIPGHRRFQPALVFESVAGVGISLGIDRVKRERPLEPDLGLDQPAGGQRRGAEVVPGFGKIGAEHQRPFQTRRRRLKPALIEIGIA